jgi:hypothetical protein
VLKHCVEPGADGGEVRARLPARISAEGESRVNGLGFRFKGLGFRV